MEKILPKAKQHNIDFTFLQTPISTAVSDFKNISDAYDVNLHEIISYTAYTYYS